VADSNPNARLECFCDGVFAIALTLLIIDVRIPPSAIASNADFWFALGNRVPAIIAFSLSFIVIFITWVNHHSTMLLVNRSSPSFIFSTGLLLFSIVLIPFPTSLLGDHLFSNHSAPAVVLYNAVLSLQATGWILLTRAAITNRLTKDAASAAAMRANNRNGYLALVTYSTLAVLAYRFPVTIAAITTMTWILWLILGISILGKTRQEVPDSTGAH
jgi:TMEM175 potassium channel family protein